MSAKDPAAKDTAPAKAPPKAKTALPDQVVLASPYGFYDDEGQFHSWSENQIVTDPAHVEILITRGAPLQE